MNCARLLDAKSLSDSVQVRSADDASFAVCDTCRRRAVLASRGIAVAAPIEIAEVKHEGDVDFEKEILPIFRRNCLACHSATEAQSDLVLESPQTILKGRQRRAGGRGGQERARACCSSWRASKKSRTCRRRTTT